MVQATASELRMGAAVSYARILAQEVFRNNTLPERILTYYPATPCCSQQIVVTRSIY